LTYIDAILDKKNNKIHVAERVNKKRRLVEITPEYVFYYEDPKGKYRSIYGDRVSKYSCNDETKFRKELAMARGKKTFESDTNVLFRALATHYRDTEIPDMLKGDMHRLKQILMHLADNAVKFTEKGEVLISADYNGRHEGKHEILFEITDTGIGIDVKNKNKLFEAFSQEDGTSTRKFEGTGIGLSICDKLVDKMGSVLTPSIQPV